MLNPFYTTWYVFILTKVDEWLLLLRGLYVMDTTESQYYFTFNILLFTFSSYNT